MESLGRFKFSVKAEMNRPMVFYSASSVTGDKGRKIGLPVFFTSLLAKVPFLRGPV